MSEQAKKIDIYAAAENANRLTLAFAKAAMKAQKDKSDNLVVSGFNMLSCFAMVAQGADANTKEQLVRTLFGMGASDLDAATANFAALNDKIIDANKDSVILKTANAMWVNTDHGVNLKRAYTEALKKVFGAEIDATSFADPATKDAMNAWGAEKTNDLIKEFVKELTPESFAILASALYFKGDWTNKFDKANTEARNFTVDGKADDVSRYTMTQIMSKEFAEGEVSYMKGDDYQAATLTYGAQDPAAGKYPTMRVLMVRPDDANVSARDWLAASEGEWMNGYAYRKAEGIVEMPLMEIEQSHDIKPVLKEMGIVDAFEKETANFRPMVDLEGDYLLYISKATQDLVFKANEQGSEGGVITKAEFAFECTSVARPPVKIDFKLDRSFVFAVQDIATGTVLFVGAVNRPNKDMKQSVQICPDFAFGR